MAKRQWMVVAMMSAIAAASLLSCGGGTVAKEADDEKAPRGATGEAAESHIKEGKVVLGAAELAVSGIKTAPASTGSVAASFKATGEVTLRNDRMAHVTARVSGAVRQVERSPGDEVTAGMPLCTLESSELGDAKAELLSAQAEAKLQERNYDRFKQLYEKGLRTQNELWQAENDLTRARLRVDAASAKLKALGASGDEEASNVYAVRSPIAGSILEVHATPGQNVEAKDELFLVGDLSELWVVASVYERDLAAVHRGMPAVARVQSFTGMSFRGTVSYVGQEVDEKTRTVPLRVTVTNQPAPGSGDLALRPGMFADVELETSRKEGVLVVPAPAVQELDGKAVVFVKAPPATDGAAAAGATFAPRTVEVGQRGSDTVEIRSGVKQGEQVVVENAYLLTSELEKSTMGDED